MRAPNRTRPLTLAIVTVLGLLVSHIGGRAIAAEPTFIPNPIFIPPPPPCISTAPLFEFPVGCYDCQVRNVSANSHGATIKLITAENQTAQTTPSVFLGPGRTISTGFCGKGFDFISCVVTTQEGTTAALHDLAVVEQYAPGPPIADGNGTGNTSPSSAETEGKIFNSCVSPTGPVSAP
ncbi:MAG TPA: hypothetical protein VJN94_05090 [Candidatus Binataceae bacterium]|nr:hypothetical protein [Candidatus Binataceae bacterium]